MTPRVLASLVVLVGACRELRDPPSTEHFGSSSEGTSTSTGAAPTDADASSGSASDVPQSPSLDACRDYCARRSECGSTIDPYLCEQACIDELVDEIDLGDCPAAHVAVLQCAVGLACAELDAPADHGCAEQVAAQTEACDTTCLLVGSETEPATMTCSARFDCGPTERALACEQGTCTCTVDDETVATCMIEIEPDCASMAAFGGPTWWWSTASACCGWDDGG